MSYRRRTNTNVNSFFLCGAFAVDICIFSYYYRKQSDYRMKTFTAAQVIAIGFESIEIRNSNGSFGNLRTQLWNRYQALFQSDKDSKTYWFNICGQHCARNKQQNRNEPKKCIFVLLNQLMRTSSWLFLVNEVVNAKGDRGRQVTGGQSTDLCPFGRHSWNDNLIITKFNRTRVAYNHQRFNGMDGDCVQWGTTANRKTKIVLMQWNIFRHSSNLNLNLLRSWIWSRHRRRFYFYDFPRKKWNFKFCKDYQTATVHHITIHLKRGVCTTI